MRPVGGWGITVVSNEVSLPLWAGLTRPCRRMTAAITPPRFVSGSHVQAASVEAQYDLGLLYAQGQGVPQDDGQAIQWFRDGRPGICPCAIQSRRDVRRGAGCPRTLPSLFSVHSCRGTIPSH